MNDINKAIELSDEEMQNIYDAFAQWYNDDGSYDNFHKSNAFKIMKMAFDKSPKISEWQLCPKCLGEGQIPNMGITSSSFKICDICNGEKKLIKPII